MKMATRVCPVCDESFHHQVRGGTQPVYCSATCRNKAANAQRKERIADLTERWCARGQHMQPASAFSGLTASYCRPCMAGRMRELRKMETPEQNYARQRKETLRRYGLTAESFAAKLASQDGRCAICRISDPGPSGWHVDHDHACCTRAKSSCGRCLRDILCTNCNKGIGSLQEDPVIIQAARDYVVAWKARLELLLQ